MNDPGDHYQLTSANGKINVTLDPNIVSDFKFLGASLTIDTSLGGDFLTINTSVGTGNFTSGSTQTTISQPSMLQLDPDAFRVGPTNGGVGTDYSITPGGALGTTTTGYLGLPSTSSFANTSSEASSTETSANAAVGLDTPLAGSVNTYLTNISVANLGTTPLGSLPFTSDPTGAVSNVIGGADVQVSDPTVNTNGLFANSPAGIISGYFRPGNQILSTPAQNLIDLLGGFGSGSALPASSTTYAAPLADYSLTGPNLTNIDPLLIDLTGNGINLTNWINGSIYFQTNVTNTGTASAPVWTSDGKLHHTSWTAAGTGILVFDPSGGAITDITQTLSEYFNGGSNPGKYADGLAALAGLTQSGQTVFSATTAATDPTTHASYWGEVRIWNDTNQNGVVDTGELQTLAAAGIASIGLTGSGNSGESIQGSAVTNRTTYTTTGGTVGQVAAVDFQTDTTGDITTTSNGGVIINSSSEGSPTTTNSFVAKNTTAHSYTLSSGVLKDGATTIGSGYTAVFSTSQNDTITVAAGDTTAYWLGGGTGTDTLTGGARDGLKRKIHRRNTMTRLPIATVYATMNSHSRSMNIAAFF